VSVEWLAFLFYISEGLVLGKATYSEVFVFPQFLQIQDYHLKIHHNLPDSRFLISPEVYDVGSDLPDNSVITQNKYHSFFFYIKPVSGCI
jgi:hypothetical protein